jgi:hypothetical protein
MEIGVQFDIEELNRRPTQLVILNIIGSSKFGGPSLGI